MLDFLVNKKMNKSDLDIERLAHKKSEPEPFLRYGSPSDNVNIAILNLVNLAYDNPSLALEAAEFIMACVGDSKK